MVKQVSKYSTSPGDTLNGMDRPTGTRTPKDVVHSWCIRCCPKCGIQSTIEVGNLLIAVLTDGIIIHATEIGYQDWFKQYSHIRYENWNARWRESQWSQQKLDKVPGHSHYISHLLRSFCCSIAARIHSPESMLS